MENKRERTSLIFIKEYTDKAEWYSSEAVFNDLITIFEAGNRRLIKRDFDLFRRKASERSICSALMLQLSSVLWGTPFSKYNADVEYNRNQDGKVKTTIDEEEVVINITCDLVLHSRGIYTKQDNLIALEMKYASRTEDEKTVDRNRLIALTKDENSVSCYDGEALPEHVCKYILGIYYEIDRNDNQINLEFYRHGKLAGTKKLNI